MRDDAARVAQDLLANLEAEVDLLEELRAVLEEERLHLVDLDVGGIERCTRAKEGVALRHRLLEEARLSLGDRLAAVQPGLGRTSSVTDVVLAVATQGLPHADDLARTSRRLAALTDAVAEMSEINKRFVAHSLLCIQGAISLLKRSSRSPDTVPATYGASGKVDERGGTPPPARLEVLG